MMSAFLFSTSIVVIKYYDADSRLLEDYLHYQKKNYPNHVPYDPLNRDELLDWRLIFFCLHLIDPQSFIEFFN